MKHYSLQIAELFKKHHGDITVVLNNEDAKELLSLIKMEDYESYHIDLAGELHYISHVHGEKNVFHMENVFNEAGKVIYNETETIILPHYLTSEVLTAMLESGGYESVIKIEPTHLEIPMT